MIKVDRPFSLYARCSVVYKGRAESTLKTGNYHILKKGDGSLIISGSSRIVPLNFQPSGAIMTRNANVLTSKRKEEEIVIVIDHIISYTELHNWSDNKIEIQKTENDLVNHIIENIDKFIPDKIIQIITEFSTPYGKVDVVAISDTHYHIIEVKRGKASINSATQLWKYMEYFHQIKQPAIGWVMSPQIVQAAVQYLQRKGLHWKQTLHPVSE